MSFHHCALLVTSLNTSLFLLVKMDDYDFGGVRALIWHIEEKIFLNSKKIMVQSPIPQTISLQSAPLT